MEPLIQKLGITKDEAKELQSMPKKKIEMLYQGQNKLYSASYGEYSAYWDHSDLYTDHNDTGPYSAHADHNDTGR